jgi:hypothetical protein
LKYVQPNFGKRHPRQAPPEFEQTGSKEHRPA